MNVKWRIAGLAAATILLIGAGGAIHYSIESASLHGTNERTIRTIAELKLDQLEQWRKAKFAEARVISNSPFFRQTLERWLTRGRDAQTKPILLDRISLPKAEYDCTDVFVASVHGELLLSVDPMRTRLDSTIVAIINRAGVDRDGMFSDFYHCTAHDDIEYGVITPIRNAEGRIIAFLGFQINPRAFLYPLLETWPSPGKTTEALILERDGDSVVYLNALRYSPNSALRMRTPLTDTANPGVQAALGRTGIFHGVDYRGEPVLSYLAPVPGTKWFLETKIDDSEIDQELYYRASTTGIITGCLMLVVAGWFALYYRSRQKNIYRNLFTREKELRKYHEEFRTILYSIGDGVITTDLNGRVKQLNHAAATLTGWLEREAVGKPVEEVFDIISEETLQPVDSPVQKVLQQGAIVGLANHTLLRSKNGDVVPIADSGAPIFGPAGQIEGTVLVFRDKTEEYRAQQQLLKSEEKYRIVAENTYDWEFWLDPDGQFLYNSPACKTTTGYDADLFYKNPDLVMAIVYDADRLRVEEHRKGYDLNRKPGSLEFRIVHADGRIRWIHHICTPVFSRDGVFLGSRGSNRDITENRHILELLQESEAKKDAIIANISEVIAIVDRHGVIKYESDNIATIFGWNPATRRGRLFTDHIHEEDVRRVRAAFDRLLENETTSTMVECRYQLHDGAYRMIELTATNLLENPLINGVLLNYHDITQRKLDENSLRESNDMLRRAEDVALMGNWKLTLGDQTIYASNGAMKIYGLAKNTIPFREVQDAVLPEYRELLDEKLLNLITRNMPYEAEFRIHNKVQGKIIAVLSKAEYDSESNTIFGVIQDVTDRKRLEHQLMQAQKLEGVGTLAGGIAHDFNNLLAMILGYAELMKRYTHNDPSLDKYVDRIIETSERGTSISRQLLVFSRPDHAELKPLSLAHLILEIREMLDHFLPKSIAVETKIEVDDDVILGDAGQVHQALLNLALNAGDAIAQSGMVTMHAFSVTGAFIAKKFAVVNPGPYVALAVSDTGVGMDESMITKIFDPFFTTKQPGKGTGLGLAMVHGIVKNHNGFIDVSSRPGKGTTFTLYFPSLQQREDAEVLSPAQSALHHDLKILLVDDEQHLREMLGDFLAGFGYRVVTASNGAEALATYRTHHSEIDLVITDLGMPQMGGEELYTRLKSINPDVNVLISSGYLDGTTTQHLLDMGIRGVLKKPYRLQVIQEEINKVVGKG